MATAHQFCPVHRIGYNSDLDPVCPQCTNARIPPQQSFDFDVVAQKPMNADGVHLDKRTLQPEK